MSSNTMHAGVTSRASNPNPCIFAGRKFSAIVNHAQADVSRSELVPRQCRRVSRAVSSRRCAVKRRSGLNQSLSTAVVR